MAIPFHDKRDGKVYYHGSDYDFSEGDTVRPGKGDNAAWASTNRDVAASYGATVYKVEPIEDVTRHPGAAKEFGIHYSRTGFRVIGKAD